MRFLEVSIVKGRMRYRWTGPRTHHFLPLVAACALPRPDLAFFMRSLTSLHARGPSALTSCTLNSSNQDGCNVASMHPTSMHLRCIARWRVLPQCTGQQVGLVQTHCDRCKRLSLCTDVAST